MKTNQHLDALERARIEANATLMDMDSARWCWVPERNVVHPRHRLMVGLVIMLCVFVTALMIGILIVIL